MNTQRRVLVVIIGLLVVITLSSLNTFLDTYRVAPLAAAPLSSSIVQLPLVFKHTSMPVVTLTPSSTFTPTNTSTSTPTSTSTETCPLQPTEQPTDQPLWALLWRDEFNGTGAVNTNDWIYDIGTSYPGGPGNWGTNEVEVMTNSTDNVFQNCGHLHIRALHSGGTPTTGWTSGRIETQRTDFQPPSNGVLAIEASIQQPNVTPNNGLGYWPAFWALGAPFRGNYFNWPGVGEFDIMEDINGRSSLFGTFHCGPVTCNEPSGRGSGEQPCPGCQTSFHTYRLEWDKSVTPNQLRWYLDGDNYFTLSQNQVDATSWDTATNHGYFILFNLSIGGAFPAAFGGGPTAGTVSGGEMVIDYVRVYTRP